jgi:hypothetical protein
VIGSVRVRHDGVVGLLVFGELLCCDADDDGDQQAAAEKLGDQSPGERSW